MANRRGLCRLCYCEIICTKTIDIFNEFNSKHNYIEKIKKYLYLNIVKCNGQPNTICIMCSEQLDKIDKFYSMIHELQVSILKDRDYEKIFLTPIYNSEPYKDENENKNENENRNIIDENENCNIVNKNEMKIIENPGKSLALASSTSLLFTEWDIDTDPNVINLIDDVEIEQVDEMVVEIRNDDPLIQPKIEPVLQIPEIRIAKTKCLKRNNNIKKMEKLQMERTNKNNNKKPKMDKKKIRVQSKSKSETTVVVKNTKQKIRNLPCTRLNDDDDDDDYDDDDDDDRSDQNDQNEIAVRDSDNEDLPSQATLNEFPKSILYNGTLLVKRGALMKLICKFFNLQCDMCERNQTPRTRFKSLHALFQHYSEVHQTNGYVKCCQKKFFRYPPMVMHMARHIQPEAFRCSECGYMVTRPAFLEAHKQTHLAEELRPFGCDKCNRKFCWKGALQIHMISHQPIHERKLYACEICDKKYDTPGGLSTHRKIIHSNEKKVAEIHVCHICAKTFSTRTSLNEHMELHEPREKKQLQCQICGKWLMNKRCLKTHMHLHSDKVFNCQECDYLTKQQTLLKRHILTHHTNNNKPFNCELCGRSFKLKRALTVHRELHKKPRVYICEFCERSFNSSTNYYTHRKQYHPTELQEMRDLIQLQQRQKRIAAGIESTESSSTIVDVIDSHDDDDDDDDVAINEISIMDDEPEYDNDDKQLIEIIEMQ